LQKHEEVHKERNFVVLLLRLDGHSEQFLEVHVHPRHVDFNQYPAQSSKLEPDAGVVDEARTRPWAMAKTIGRPGK